MRARKRIPKGASVQAIAGALIALFCFQISRVYLVTQVDAFFPCPYTQIWTSTVSNDEADAGAQPGSIVVETAAPREEDGTSIRSCKDTFEGIALSPVQPLGAPVAIALQWPHVYGPAFPQPLNGKPERCPIPPFQPPRV